MLYLKYHVEEDKKLEHLLINYENLKTGLCMKRKCSNEELNRVYGFNSEKNYEKFFKDKGINVVSIIVY